MEEPTRGPKTTAFAPATVANLGPGFDVLGLALDQPGDRVTMWLDDSLEPGIFVEAVTGLSRPPRDAKKNTAAIAAQRVLEMAGATDVGLGLRLEKGLPVGSGLGSSGASAAAAAVAADAVLGANLSMEQLFSACLAAEEMACGAAHGDNVAPSLLGGAVVLMQGADLGVVPVAVPDRLWLALATPTVEVKTSDARAALPETVPLKDAVFTAGQVGAMVAAFASGDLEVLRRAIVDRLHVPVRSQFIPGYGTAEARAMEAGAIGVSVSGSGPTMFAFADGQEAAERIAAAMRDAFSDTGIIARSWASRAGGRGAHVISGVEQAIA